MKKSDWKKMIKIQLKKDIEKQTMKIEKTSSKMRHQKIKNMKDKNIQKKQE